MKPHGTTKEVQYVPLNKLVNEISITKRLTY